MNYWRHGNIFITCTKAGGIFKEGDSFPFYFKGGYPYIVLIERDTTSAKTLKMDSYEDDTFKIIGYEPEWEDAEFKVKGVI